MTNINIDKAVAALAESVDADDAQAEALAQTFEECRDHLEKIDQGDEATGLIAEPRHADDTADGDVKLPTLADILSMTTRGKERALALLLATKKYSKEESNTMTTPERLEAERMAKLRAVSPVDICKALVAENSARGITEAELVGLISNFDRGEGETEAMCFTRHYEAQDEVRKAVAICKAAEAAPYFDLQPVFVGDAALDVDDPSEAIAQLTRIGRQKWPTASEAEAFERAFTDPANAELAKKAYRRPSATSVYPMPR